MRPADQKVTKAVRLFQRRTEARTDESRCGTHDERQEGKSYQAAVAVGQLCTAFALGIHWKPRKRTPVLLPAVPYTSLGIILQCTMGRLRRCASDFKLFAGHCPPLPILLKKSEC